MVGCIADSKDGFANVRTAWLCGAGDRAALAFTCCRQCLPNSVRCNGVQDCRDSSDEDLCRVLPIPEYYYLIPVPPAVVNMDGRGGYTVKPLTNFSQCPETHFLCHGTYFSFLRLSVPVCLSAFPVSLCLCIAVSPSVCLPMCVSARVGLQSVQFGQFCCTSHMTHMFPKTDEVYPKG